MGKRDHNWWKNSIVYQIYPRSFQDTNGDGIGDLQGIIRRLDYISDLGVDVIWVCPVYESPNHDNGYDVRDYCSISKEFGTIEDMKRLIEECSTRNIKVLMDLVVNHTSDEHEWFQASRSDCGDSKRNWYIWAKGRDGAEPNDLISIFGGSAWEYDESSDEYYFHLFSKHQPDLNWDHPQVRGEVLEMIRWWLDLGIAGFRMDAITYIKKNRTELLTEQRSDPHPCVASVACMNQPGVLEYLREIKQTLDQYEAVSVAEAPGIAHEQIGDYTGTSAGVFDMIFTFEHVDIDIWGLPKGATRSWNLRMFKKALSDWQTAANQSGWLALFFENHDMVRSVSKFGNSGLYRTESAKMLATWYMLMRGTPFIFQGQEIGMTNYPFTGIEEYRDIDAINYYREATANGIAPETVLAFLDARGRDHSRTPMQWNDKVHAGFTSGDPWIRVNPNYPEIKRGTVLCRS
ncbi:MAG: alpha-glucosidase [Eubacteriales bacterium]|jgi:glycosidase|nr:alpha-glucosidase [Eubacteriales bacterium]